MRCLLVLLCAGPLAAAEPADLILHSGKVVTVDDKFRVVEAVAIRGDRIAAVGSNDAVLSHKGPKTVVVDLKGKTVLPGLMDTPMAVDTRARAMGKSRAEVAAMRDEALAAIADAAVSETRDVFASARVALDELRLGRQIARFVDGRVARASGR